MNNMYEILSDNLVRLRKSRNLTQAEFAEIIKYSDKSVSKWETGMSVPGLDTLLEIADFYGMTIDDLVRKPVDSEKVEIVEQIKKTNKLSIVLLSVAAIWLLATVIFVYTIFNGNLGPYWEIFVWATPLSFTLTTVFSAIWNRKFLLISLSCLLWGLIASFFIEFRDMKNAFLFFIIGIPIQVIIILCRGFRKDVLEESVERQTLYIKKRQERKRLRNQLKEADKEKSE